MQVKEKEPDPEECSVCDPLVNFRPWQKSIVVAASVGEQGTAYQEGNKGMSYPRAVGVNTEGFTGKYTCWKPSDYGFKPPCTATDSNRS